MKGGYFAGMLAGGLIGMAAAMWLMPYIKPTISTAVEKGKDFVEDAFGMNVNSQK
jgi:gas vesicle protein